MTRHIAYQSTVEPLNFSEYIKRIFIGLLAGVSISIVIGAVVWFLSVGLPYEFGESGNPIALFCYWLYETQISIGIRESIWLFPIVEGIHLLGIAVSVGALCWFDLRLLGLALRDEPVSGVWKHVMPVAFVGFALVFITGILLFWAESRTAYQSVHFWIKLALILAAGLNAWLFESKLHKHMHEWDTDAIPPRAAQIAGAVSLVLWAVIIITGRTMAYTF